MSSINLGAVKIPVETYASQGNAILGIRGSGKTYTATCVAERLLKAKIPFVAFDPIGVWRYLKVPGQEGKGEGFKVVVAGEKGDLPLTPESAPEIVRAAMRENIPLVIDLYSMRLSKADWRRIVESAIRLLLYENKEHGLRHVFIEEAAEFCPQNIGGELGRVYAEVEKLSRMGRNAGLGYTIINQRAEQVNKAVLENCNRLFLHRQMGRNSLKALETWLAWANQVDPDRARDIAKTLPTLKAGECWVWSDAGDEPERVKIPEKLSFHPDDKATGKAVQNALSTSTDVGKFVEQLKGALGRVREKVESEDPKVLQKRIRELETEIAKKPEAKTEVKEVSVLTAADRKELRDLTASLHSVLVDVQRVVETAETRMDRFKNLLLDDQRQIRPVQPHSPRAKPHETQLKGIPGKIEVTNGSLTGGAKRMLIALAQRPHGLNRKQLGVRAGLSSSSGTFGTYLGKLRSSGYVIDQGEKIVITVEGTDALGVYDPLPEGRALLEYWLGELTGGARRMLEVIASQYPDAISADRLGELATISPSSGTFGTYLGKLRTLELVTGGRDALRMSEELAE